ncbi:MAG: hypothetical protein QOD39_261, partial [Mycobacterium sp.]|nr:hypothetical protein [Mycobacterium sp.]
MAATRRKSARPPSRRPVRTPRRRPADAVVTPFIARQPENSDEYLRRLEGLISANTTHVYFDTSFLMWLTKLGRPAREQFFAWVNAADPKRFHVPLWGAHEFFKHQTKNTIHTELRTELVNFEDATTRLYKSIRAFCCDDLFGFPSSSDMFLDEYRRTIQPIRTMIGSAKSNLQQEVKFGLAQVAEFIDKRLLPGALSQITDGLESEEQIRYRGLIPPGFNDAHKGRGRDPNAREEPGDNRFGDLALWREVLAHAAKVRARTLIVATGDRKNDWFINHHGNEGLTPEFRKRVPDPRPVPLPQPLLLREAADRGAGDLVLIDPMYCAVLMEKKGRQYKTFAAAFLDTNLPKLEIKRAQAQLWSARLGQAANLGEAPAADEQPPAANGEEQDQHPPANAPAPELQIDTIRKPPEECAGDVAAFLAKFREANVAVRTDLYEQFDWEQLPDWGADDLVVLGREMSDHARTQDPVATRFITDLRDQAAELDAVVVNALYLGALGAVYFNSELQRRPLDGSASASVLLDVVDLPLLHPAASTIGAALAGTRPAPIFVPGSAPAGIALQFSVQPSADNKAHADLLAVDHD